MSNKTKHLEFIQTVVDRQGKNSFLIKGWTITIITAILAFWEKGEVFRPVLLVYALVFIFGMLDSYYLWQERLFRALYDHVRKLKESEIDFNMDVKDFSKRTNCSWWDIATSKTITIFYLSLMVFTIIFFSWR